MLHDLIHQLDWLRLALDVVLDVQVLRIVIVTLKRLSESGLSVNVFEGIKLGCRLRLPILIGPGPQRMP